MGYWEKTRLTAHNRRAACGQGVNVASDGGDKPGTTRTKVRPSVASSAARCPQLAPTHSPFAHTLPHEPAADRKCLRRNSHKFLTVGSRMIT
ncbi:MAG: hypothetical protein [Olavius algarvensis Gamma 1 endosymbiont]|nr:MAG: hypothetical protein [Olavius algarvensis Gamma 1 endosymbiont]